MSFVNMLISDLPKLEPNEAEVPNQPVDEYISLKTRFQFYLEYSLSGFPDKKSETNSVPWSPDSSRLIEIQPYDYQIDKKLRDGLMGNKFLQRRL